MHLMVQHDILPNIVSFNRLLWLGWGLLLLGAISVIAPFAAGNAWTFIVGAILFVAGIANLHASSQSGGKNSRLLTGILGAVTIAGAIIILAYPVLAPSIVTSLLFLYFAGDGAWKIIQSMRYMSTPGWHWLLASGVLSLILGLLIWRQWPLSGGKAAAVLVGINLISTGTALIAFASSVKQTVRNLLSPREK
jgi:uncharacterized membrane protein HdeD (DUF308 family)